MVDREVLENGSFCSHRYLNGFTTAMGLFGKYMALSEGDATDFSKGSVWRTSLSLSCRRQFQNPQGGLAARSMGSSGIVSPHL